MRRDYRLLLTIRLLRSFGFGFVPVLLGLRFEQRGLGGGVSLVRSPEQVTILEVVNAVGPIRRIQSCPLELASHGVRLCPLHRRLDNALGLVEDAFRQTTLAEVLAEPSASVPLCDFPGRASSQPEA